MPRAKKMCVVRVCPEDGSISTPGGGANEVTFPCEVGVLNYRNVSTIVHSPHELAQFIYDLDTIHFYNVSQALEYVQLVCKRTTDPAHFRETGTSKDQGDLMAIYQ